MKRRSPTRAEFERAVELALSAIEAECDRRRSHEHLEPPPPAVTKARLVDKIKREEWLSPKEQQGLALALEHLDARGRGAPRGPRNWTVLAAFKAAAMVLEIDDILTVKYGNRAGGNAFTLCRAIAEAMGQAGFKTHNTPQAIEQLMRIRAQNMPRNYTRAFPSRASRVFPGSTMLGRSATSRSRPAIPSRYFFGSIFLR